MRAVAMKTDELDSQTLIVAASYLIYPSMNLMNTVVTASWMTIKVAP